MLAVAPSAGAEAELTVSPLFIEQKVDAGDVITEQITASATGDEAITVELVHADFGFTGEDYGVVLIRDDAPDTTAFSTRGWFSMPKARYTIPAGGSRDLPLRIEVPSNTPGGTYLGAALLRVLPPDIEGSGSQVQAVPETGPLVFISIEGGDPPKPVLSTFDVPEVVSGGPIRPDLQIENRGDEFFTFDGTIKLTGPGPDDTIEVDRQFVVPGEPRTIRTSPDEKDERGLPEVGTADLDLGRYEITTRLRIEPTGATIVSTRTVWVIPTWVRAAGVAALLVLMVCIGLLVRWFRRRDGEPIAAPPADEEEAWDEDSLGDDEDDDPDPDHDHDDDALDEASEDPEPSVI